MCIKSCLLCTVSDFRLWWKAWENWQESKQQPKAVNLPGCHSNTPRAEATNNDTVTISTAYRDVVDVKGNCAVNQFDVIRPFRVGKHWVQMYQSSQARVRKQEEKKKRRGKYDPYLLVMKMGHLVKQRGEGALKRLDGAKSEMAFPTVTQVP